MKKVKAVLSDSELWEHVKSLTGKPVYTLTTRRPNTIVEVTENRVKIKDRKTEPTRGAIYTNYQTLYNEGRLTGKEGNFCGMYVILAILSEAVRDEIDIIKGEIRLK